MVLLSFLLVLAAAITLVIGLLSSGLGLIYLSIACSLGAGVVLALAVLRSRPRAEPVTAGAPAPASAPSRPAPAPEPAGVGARSGVTLLDREPAGGEAAEETRAWDQAAFGAPSDEMFPIADYDDLTAAEIVPLLPELDDDELEMVRDREEAGASRKAVLDRIDALLAGEEEEAPVKAASRTGTTKKAAAKKAAAKKSAAKKSAVKKAAASKAATAKTATAKKASAKKAAGKKAAAKKAAAAKGTTTT